LGRTIPSFRLASVEEEKEWKVFRNALDKSDRRDIQRDVVNFTFIQFSALKKSIDEFVWGQKTEQNIFQKEIIQRW
jgi:hypothetical protein